MDYLHEYINVLKVRISDLEVQVAILRSLLPVPPPHNMPAPALKPQTPAAEVKKAVLSVVPELPK